MHPHEQWELLLFSPVFFFTKPPPDCTFSVCQVPAEPAHAAWFSAPSHQSSHITLMPCIDPLSVCFVRLCAMRSAPLPLAQGHGNSDRSSSCAQLLLPFVHIPPVGTRQPQECVQVCRWLPPSRHYRANACTTSILVRSLACTKHIAQGTLVDASATLQPSPCRNRRCQLCCFPSLFASVLFAQIQNNLLRFHCLPLFSLAVLYSGT